MLSRYKKAGKVEKSLEMSGLVDNVDPDETLLDQKRGHIVDTLGVPLELVGHEPMRDDAGVSLGELEHLCVIDAHALWHRLDHVAAVAHRDQRERVTEQC